MDMQMAEQLTKKTQNKQPLQMNEEWVNILFHLQLKYNCKVFYLWKKTLKPFAKLTCTSKEFYTIHRERCEDIGQETLVICYIQAL